ncbi:hypothetical protein BN1723_004162, partial [Verticillium longisporum]
MSLRYHVGAATGSQLLDPWAHGLSGMKDVFASWSRLDITQIGSLIAIAATLPTAWRFIHRIWSEAAACVRRFFLASVTIPGGDPVNASVVKWVLENRPRHHRSFTGRTDVGHVHSDRGAALKKSQQSIQYSPHWNSRWIWYDGTLIMVARRIDDFNASLSDPRNDGMGGEELTLSCFGWSAEPLKAFIEGCREYSEKQTQFFVIIYSRDPKTKRRYQSRSMPYRRGYLFYGPPGTGKSSLSVALAGEFGLDLYEVKIPSVATDADLEQMFQEVPPRCVVLLEDIDAVWVDRSNPRPSSQDGNMTPNCTLSGLLNVLDGVGSQEGRIVIMTTNRPEQLDSALVRPGRVDMKVLLGNISQRSAEEMFVRMFSPELGCTTPLEMDEVKRLAARFAAEVPEDLLTPSQLQGFFQLHLESPHDAASSIKSWVETELERMPEKSFELVSGRKSPSSTLR